MSAAQPAKSAKTAQTAKPTHTVPSYSAAQVREAELPLLEAGEPLMAKAAAALARVIEAQVRELAATRGRVRTLILAGAGNNGGDALYAAANLAHLQPLLTIDVLTVADRWHEDGLAAAQGAGAERRSLAEVLTQPYDLLVDGVLGIGTAADPSLRGAAREVVEALLPQVRAGEARVVAVDIPSGLHPDTGQADDAVLPATVTVTFGAVKHGLTIGCGPELAGELCLVPIGLEPLLAHETPLGTATVSLASEG